MLDAQNNVFCCKYHISEYIIHSQLELILSNIIIKDEILVKILPTYEVKKPDIISKIPAPNSNTQTKEDKSGLKLKKSISFCKFAFLSGLVRCRAVRRGS